MRESSWSADNGVLWVVGREFFDAVKKNNF